MYIHSTGERETTCEIFFFVVRVAGKTRNIEQSVLQFQWLLSGDFRKQEQGSGDVKWFILFLYFSFECWKKMFDKNTWGASAVAGLEWNVLYVCDENSKNSAKFPRHPPLDKNLNFPTHHHYSSVFLLCVWVSHFIFCTTQHLFFIININHPLPHLSCVIIKGRKEMTEENFST